MMTKSNASTPVQANLFKVLLRDIVYPQHELILLRDAIDWERFEKVLEPVYCQNNGRPSIPVRTMVGLMMLRTMYGLSDQEVLDGWVENPYWQSFCGGTFFEHEPPTDQSIMSRWRSRVGETGVTEMLKESVAAAVRSKVAKRRDFEKVNIDTTVQEKNVRFPTDARTLDRARERVVAVGEKLGIRFKRTYVRKGKTMLRKHSGYVKAKQFNRAENAVRTLKQYLRNVIDFAESQPVVPRNTRELGLIVTLQEYVARSRRLLAQDRDTPGKDKIYSFHEPQVECIAKGKVHTRYEFGVKASFVTASRTNWVLGAMAIPGNPYDGNTLAEVLKQAESICGTKPGHAYCDLGYRGHNYTGDIDIQVVSRFRKKRPRALLRWWKRRSAIEPVIGHIKSDHGMDRNMLAGSTGDRLNAMLAGVGFNLLKLMKGLGRLFLYLHAEAAGFAEFLSAFVRFWLCDAPQLRHPLSSRCGLLKLGFA